MTRGGPGPERGSGPTTRAAGAGSSPVQGSDARPGGQLRFGDVPNAGPQLQRLREATLAVADATYRRGRRRRYGVPAVALFAVLASHTGPDGIARVSALQLAAELGRDSANVRAELRALARGGFARPLEYVDGVFVAASRHPRHRAGYLLPGMVAPPPTRPHIVQ